MKPFPHGPGHLICRHWNGSPVELGMTKRFVPIQRGLRSGMWNFWRGGNVE